VGGGAIRGGTGWADWKDLPDLPDEVEHCYPAYEMFGCEIAMGFLTRGCIRKCPFCIVSEKEGVIHHHAHLSEWWRGQKQIRLLDPNITAHPDILDYLDELAASRAQVNFTQGVDARLITPEIAIGISKVRRYKQVHTAWDLMKDEERCLRGVGILRDTLPRGSVMVYVLIGFNTTPEEDLYRVERLRELNVDPFVMPFDKKNNYQKRFARWCNFKAIFKTVAWQDYGNTFYN